VTTVEALPTSFRSFLGFALTDKLPVRVLQRGAVLESHSDSPFNAVKH
jgi:hypothetical protein